MCEPSDDKPLSGPDEVEHKVWSSVLDFCSLSYLGQRFQDYLADVELGSLD